MVYMREDAPVACNDVSRRGTSDIIWSCLVTIFACTWVALHPNIPGQHCQGFVATNIRRVKTMTVALVAPELIILWATRQWFAARGLARQHKEYGWTKTHGFFAQMGGFVYEEKFRTQTIFPDELDRYLRDGAIDITEEEIQDRSKADMLAKCLVILQTSWFILQFFARISRRLPVTELELVTLAFAMLNFVTYFFWWNKPLNLTCPVRITARSPQPTSQDSPTSSYISSPIVENLSGVFGPGDLPTSSNGQSIARFKSNDRLVFKTVPVMLSADDQPTNSDGQHSLIEGFEDHFEGDLGCLTPFPPMDTLPSIAPESDNLVGSSDDPSIRSNDCLVFKTVPVMLGADDWPIDSDGQHSLIEAFEDHFEGDLGRLTPSLPMDLSVHHTGEPTNTNRQSQTTEIGSARRWGDSVVFYKRGNSSNVSFQQVDDSFRARWARSGVVQRLYLIIVIPIQEFVNLTILDGRPFRINPIKGVSPYYHGHLKPYEGLMASLLATSIATIFGAIHCAAWFFQFPSRTEQILWRTSAVLMTCMPVVGFLLMLAIQSGHMLLIQAVPPISFLYFLARLILLVQMFLLLRSLSPEIYTTIHWIDLIPHI